MPRTPGYQQNLGVGDSIINTDYGESILPEVKAMRRNQTSNALGKFAGATQFPIQTIANYTPAMLSEAAKNAFITAGSKMATVGNPIQQGIGKALTQFGQNATTKGVLNTAGTVAGALGTAYGAYNVYNDIAHAGNHRSAGQMLETRGQDTVSTEYGNQYKQYRGVDTGAELDYAKQNRIGKQLGLTADLMGLGASVGSIIPGLGTLFGAGLGAAAGLLGGGVASLLGFGDTEDETKEQLALVTDQTARQNRQARAVAEDADTKAAFANGAANGKIPGRKLGKPVAKLSGGEVVQLGPIKVEVPGPKNNKDQFTAKRGTIIGEMVNDPRSVVWTNKEGVSDFIKNGGDESIALEVMKNVQEKYKNGKVPKYIDGKWFSMIPSFISGINNLGQYFRAKEASVKAPDTYVDNAGGNAALNVMAGLRYDPRPYYEQAGDALRQANWNTARQPGLGMGGRAIAQNANFNAYLQNLMKVNWAANEATNNYRQTYAKMLAEQGARDQQLRMSSAAQRHQWMQQANAARENWMAQYLKNIDTNLLNMASEYMKWGQYNDAKEAQNKMLSLYQQQVDNDTYKAHRDIANLGNNTSTPITRQNKIEVPSMISRPSDNYGYVGSITNLLNGIQTPYTLQQNYKNWYNPQWGGIGSHKVR